MEELGIYSDKTNKTSTCEEQQYCPDTVTKDHARSMDNKFNIKLAEKELK